MKKLLFLAAMLISLAATAQVQFDGSNCIERNATVKFSDGFCIDIQYEPTVFGMTNAMMKTWHNSNPSQPEFLRVRIDNALPGVTRFFSTTKLVAVYDNIIGMLSVMKGEDDCEIHYAAR